MRMRLRGLGPFALFTVVACGGATTSAVSDGGDAAVGPDSPLDTAQPMDGSTESSTPLPDAPDDGAVAHDSGRDAATPADAADGSEDSAPECGALNANCIQGSDCCSRVCGPTGLCTAPTGADAGAVCGQVTCNPGQICVYPCCETPMGSCWAPCTVGPNGCVPPPPSCVDVTPACAQGTDCSCFQGPNLCQQFMGCPIEAGTVQCAC